MTIEQIKEKEKLNKEIEKGKYTIDKEIYILGMVHDKIEDYLKKLKNDDLDLKLSAFKMSITALEVQASDMNNYYIDKKVIDERLENIAEIRSYGMKLLIKVKSMVGEK